MWGHYLKERKRIIAVWSSGGKGAKQYVFYSELREEKKQLILSIRYDKVM